MARGRRHLSGESGTSQCIPLPPDGGYGWVIVMASFASHVIVDGITFTFGIFYSEFSEYYGGSKGQISLVGALLAGCYLLAAPFAGSMVNKFGCRAVSIAGSLIATVGFLASIAAPSVHLLTLTYGVIGGFGLGVLYLPNVIAVSYYFERRRALATGIAVCGAGVGTFVMAPVGRWLLDLYDWKNAMFFVAGITLNGCVFGALLRPLVSPRVMKVLADDISLDDDDVSQIAKTNDIFQKLGKVSGVPDSAILLDEASAEGNGRGHQSNSDVDDDDDVIDDECRPPVSHERRRSYSDAHVYARVRLRGGRLEKVDDPHSHENCVEGTEANSRVPAEADDADKPQEVAALGDAGRRYKSEMCVGPAERRRISNERRQRSAHYARPLYRRDIFYSGSTMLLPEFQEESDVRSFMRHITDVPDESASSEDHGDTKCSRLSRYLPPLSRAIKDAWKRMTNLSLLKDPIFVVPCLANLFGTIGLFVPFVYCIARAQSLGVDSHSAAFLLSIIGITNTLGRIVAGCIASLKRVNSLLLHNVALLAAGLTCIAHAAFGVNYAAMATLAAIFGLCIATWISLTSVVLCDLLGLERLTNAFGLLTMTRGLAAMVGSPMAGFVFDMTGNYDASFYVGGAMMTAGGLLCCVLHLPYFRSSLVAGGQQMSGESGFEDLDSEVVHEPSQVQPKVLLTADKESSSHV